MVSVYLPSDGLLQHLPSYLGFSYLGHGVFLHVCPSKAQPLLLTLDEGYLLTTTLPEVQCGIAPLGPPAPAQPLLLGCGVAPLGCSCTVAAWHSRLRYVLWSQPPALTSGGQSIGASASALVLPTIFRIDFFRIGWLVLAVLGTFKSLLQHGSSKTPFLHCSAFFMVQLSHD